MTMRTAPAFCAGIAVCVTTDGALAEVCAKIASENWQLTDGPVTSVLGQKGFENSQRVAVYCVGLCAVGCAAGLRFRFWLVAALTGTVLLLSVAGLLLDVVDPVHTAAIREGCATEEVPEIAIPLQQRLMVTAVVVSVATLLQALWNKYCRGKAD